MKILVIGGGISDEREVSLRSSRAVLEAAENAGYDIEFYDWDGSDTWLKENAVRFAAVLPVLHGKGGEDGVIQALLQEIGVPYLGSTAEVAEQCFDKHATREAVSKLGYLVPEGAVMTYKEYVQSDLSKRPHVIKPVMGGSSIHTHIIKDVSQKVEAAIENTFQVYTKLLVEECITGVEITAGVLDGKHLQLVEIIPPEGELFDYENKYNGATTELCPPQSINTEIQSKAIDMAEKIHKSLGCRHLSRTDIIVSGEELYFLEINTIPGMTDQSLFPKAAAAVGLDFPKLVDYFIKLVLNKV